MDCMYFKGFKTEMQLPIILYCEDRKDENDMNDSSRILFSFSLVRELNGIGSGHQRDMINSELHY